MDLSSYDIVSKDGAALTEGLMRIWERLGQPDDCSTEAGWKMVDQIVNCWTNYFKAEVADWQHDRQIDLRDEMTLKQLAKKEGGYNPITYPPTLFYLIKSMLPRQKLTDKKFQRALAQRHNLFKSTNLGL